MKRRVLFALISGLALSFIVIFSWFLLFGYNPDFSWLENLGIIFSNTYFWTAFGIWAVFFSIFFTLPLAFMLSKNHQES